MPGVGRLVLVGTPLGNRDDLAPRGRAAILGADLLLCEDTRSPTRLLGAEVELPPRMSCFAGNEDARVHAMLEHLARGQTVAFVSEAGMPVWSDPGRALVEAAVGEGFEVEVIPGPTAAATALCHSGFSARLARFVGFLPRDGGERRALVGEVADEPGATILYEAGPRVSALLKELAAALPDAAGRRAVVARELTKLHQEVLRGTVAELAARIDGPVRGEVTVVIEGTGRARVDPGQATAREVLAVVLDGGLKPRARAKRLAELTGVDARTIYGWLQRGSREEPSG